MTSSPATGSPLSINLACHSGVEAIKTGIEFMKPTLESKAH